MFDTCVGRQVAVMMKELMCFKGGIKKLRDVPQKQGQAAIQQPSPQLPHIALTEPTNRNKGRKRARQRKEKGRSSYVQRDQWAV